MSTVHLGARNGYTACAIFIPDMEEGDRYWIPPPGEEPPGPVTCKHCLRGERAPGSSKDPRSLRMVIVYAKPRDFPGEYVAREVFVDAKGQHNGEIVASGPTLGACRAGIHEHNHGLVCIPRHPDDNPVIVESWA